MNFVDFYNDSGLGVITMNNSRNGNRLNQNTLVEINRAFAALENSKNIRVILIRSDGNPFCLGMDLDFLRKIEGNQERQKKAVELYSNLLLSIYRSSKPVISVVIGAVKAGGIGLVAACDINIASNNSTFELNEVLLGLLPANVLPFLLLLRLSPQKTRYLTLTMKKLTAKEAKMLHLVDEVYPKAMLEREVKSIIKTLFRTSPDALAESKKFTESLLNKNMDIACDMAKEQLLEIVNKGEVKNAISSFESGEVPSWFKKFRPKKPIVL